MPAPNRQASNHRARRVRHLAAAIAVLGALIGLVSGCMTRSTTVGDRFSGEIIVATSPDNPRGAPRLDVPQSMASLVTVNEYTETADKGASKSGSEPTRIGSRASYSNLTAGQFSQLGDIVAGAFDSAGMSMDVTGKRSGDIVRLRGTADLSELVNNRDYIRFTTTFAGPIVATNGEQTGEQTVSWTLPAGKSATLNADSDYADPATAAVSSWSWLLAFLCLAVVVIVARFALSNRDRSPRPGAPAANR